MNKTKNHSERNRIAQNDRCHFTDDLYYQRKRYGKKWPASCSGPVRVSWYRSDYYHLPYCANSGTGGKASNIVFSVQQLYHHIKL